MENYGAKGVWLKKIHEPQYDVLPDKTIRELIDKAHQGCEESKEKVVHANLRLVVLVINNDVQCPDRLWMDCVSEGNMVLMKCVDDYKTDSNAKFSYLVGNTLRWRMWRFVDRHEHAVRMTEYCLTKIRKKEKAEVFEKGMIDKIDDMDVPISRGYMLSIDIDDQHPLKTERNKGLMNLIKDDRSQLIYHCLECLTEKEKAVIINRWLGERKGTLREVAEIIGRSKQRVRQLEEQAFYKMKIEMMKREHQENLNIQLANSTSGCRV